MTDIQRKEYQKLIEYYEDTLKDIKIEVQNYTRYNSLMNLLVTYEQIEETLDGIKKLVNNEGDYFGDETEDTEMVD